MKGMCSVVAMISHRMRIVAVYKATTLKPKFPVLESGVFEVRAPTR